MIRKSRLLAVTAIIACALATSFWAAENVAESGTTQPSADLAKLNGVWILADTDAPNCFFWASHSKLTIRDGKFSISRFCETSKRLEGTFKLEPSSARMAVNIATEPVDLSERWNSSGYPAFNAAGIYKLDGNRLTVCVNKSSNSPRPTSLAPTEAGGTMMFAFVRAPADFRDFPSDITVHVADPAGKPIVGAELFTHMFIYSKAKAPRAWHNSQPLGTTGPDGIARVSYDKADAQPVILRDGKRGLMAVLPNSPADAIQRSIHVTLRPECHVHGRLQWNATVDATKPIGWSTCSLNFRAARIAQNIDPPRSSYEFHVPPGEYSLAVRGERFEAKSIKIVVPEGRLDYEVPPFLLNPSKLTLLEGKPAPELSGVIAWRGKPVKLADLKGKYVLLDFWGYWCGPCVAAIPSLIDLHERFKDRGLAIIGVHVELEGDVTTVAKLNEKLASIRKSRWNGKDISFPVALTEDDPHSKLPTADRDYGIEGFPTQVLIDREGRVVGQFSVRDEAGEIEKLLKK